MRAPTSQSFLILHRLVVRLSCSSNFKITSLIPKKMEILQSESIAFDMFGAQGENLNEVPIPFKQQKSPENIEHKLVTDLLTELVSTAVVHVFSQENIPQKVDKKDTSRPFSDIPTSRAELDRLRKEAALRNYVGFEPLLPVYQPVMSIPMEQVSNWSLLKTRLSQKMQSVTTFFNTFKGVKFTITPTIPKALRFIKTPFSMKMNM